ncbi:MAG: PAS-domain containing protein [Acetobacteraceae bacterium]
MSQHRGMVQADAVLTPVPLASAIAAVQVGIAIVDAQQRIVLMNPAFLNSLDLPADGFPPGTPVIEAVRAAALRGVYGPGDPDAQVAAVMAPDRSRPGRLRRRTYKGRSFDLYNAPLPDGGYVVSAIETTALLAARAEAEKATSDAAAALATLRIGLAAFRPDGALIFANPRFGELLALPPERLLPGTRFGVLIDLIATRDEYAGADGIAFVAEQLAANRLLPWQVRRVRGDGRVIDVVSAPLPDGAWTISVTDVSPLVQAEDEAQRRARLLDTILEEVPHGICVYGADHRVRIFNRAYSAIMTGAPLRIGDHMADIVRRRAESGEWGPGNSADICSQQMAFDITRPQRRRRRRPNGTAIDIRTAPLPDGGHISVVTDITALVEAEDEVSRRAEVMTTMLASIRHGVVLWGPDNRLVASNAMAGELIGYPDGVLVPGRTDAEVLALLRQRGEWDENSDPDASIRSFHERDRSRPFARHVVTRARRVLEIQSDPVPHGGWISTYTDITEARAAEEALRRSRDAAEAANQAKSRFLATMSHELRTPLNAVIGFSDALMREGETPDPARIKEFAQAINTAGRDLLSLINIILDVARIESGRFDLTSDQVDVARLIRTAMRQAEGAAHAAEITLVADISADLPQLRSDERRLLQALNQVLSNAVKFSNAGGTVTVGARLEADGNLLLFVRDTGIGIAEADLERVFEPFTQLDNTLARRYQGAGLGLYIARAMVSGHGGTLTLASWPGQGTLAEIRMPRERLVH